VADALRRAAGCEREATQLRQEARSLRAQLLRQEDEQAQLQALLLKHEALARSFGAVSSTKVRMPRSLNATNPSCRHLSKWLDISAGVSGCPGTCGRAPCGA
jgi:hypothetical protein